MPFQLVFYYSLMIFQLFFFDLSVKLKCHENLNNNTFIAAFEETTCHLCLLIGGGSNLILCLQGRSLKQKKILDFFEVLSRTI